MRKYLIRVPDDVIGVIAAGPFTVMLNEWLAAETVESFVPNTFTNSTCAFPVASRYSK